MLKLPDSLTPDDFLKRHWQKKTLLMPRALPQLRPSISRNELGWLATLEDVESRLVFVDNDGGNRRYRAETGPFDPEYLADLPKGNWSLLVHDVEKHLPAMRALFKHVPFIPDWRIDDLMVSFAAPGGGVGPHVDNYDVFLCQGIGVRNWRFTEDDVAPNSAASSDLALLHEIDGGDESDLSEGDVLYLPPGVAHWGTAKRACMTYSIGMRAPQASDLSVQLDCEPPNPIAFYRDANLGTKESSPGLISSESVERALTLLALPKSKLREVARSLGLFATQPKGWLQPDSVEDDEVRSAFEYFQNGGTLSVHGMSKIAFDEHWLFVNGRSTELPAAAREAIGIICNDRRLSGRSLRAGPNAEWLLWMLGSGAFEIPENS